MNRLNELLKRIHEDPYNEVAAHALPDGGLELVLSHRITMDAAVLVRIPSDSDVRFFDRVEDEEALERTNLGGPWNA